MTDKTAGPIEEPAAFLNSDRSDESDSSDKSDKTY